MKKRILTLLLAVCLLLTVIPCAYAAQEPVTVLVDGTSCGGYAQEVMELVNSSRADAQLQPLFQSWELSRLATQRAAEIALYYDGTHTRPDGTAWYTVLEGTDFLFGMAGENIAAGYSNPESVMEGWMNSSGHRANILDENYTCIGVGCFSTNGVYYWVQLFSSESDENPHRGRSEDMFVPVSTLPQWLDTPDGGTLELTLEVGEEWKREQYNTNQGFSPMKTCVVPLECDITDDTGRLIARLEYTGSEAAGMDYRINAIAPGEADYTMRFYEGQEPGWKYHITVEGEEKYPIEVRTNGGLGNPYVRPTEAAPGETVTLHTGYGSMMAGMVLCEDQAGNNVPVTQVDRETFTITMPDGPAYFMVYYCRKHEHEYGDWRYNEQGWLERQCPHCYMSQRRYELFEDVEPERFYYAPVMWAFVEGVTKGITDTTFQPESDCTRGQVVTFLWRAAGCPEPTVTEHPFTDVKEGAFYYEAMLWAVEQGVTKGMTETTFGPDEPCTRGQVVTFLHRALGLPQPGGTGHPFTDVKETAFYYQAMLWAVEEGVTSGVTPTTFVPDEACTRGQIVTFLYRAFAE